MNIDRITIGNFGAVLECYLPDCSQEMPGSAVRSAVLIFPGGGYFRCSDREAEPVALAFAGEGYCAFTLRYSTGEDIPFETKLHEAEEALALIVDRSEEWHIAPQRIVAVGFSAGGHLASALGVLGRVRPAALVLGYPCILASIGPILAHPVPDVSVAVDAHTPPTFLFTTRDDAVVPVENTLAFASALVLHNIAFEMHIYRQGRHGLSLARHHTSAGEPDTENIEVAGWFSLCTAWLKETL